MNRKERIVGTETLQNIMDYLITRPYKEVVNLIIGLQSDNREYVPPKVAEDAEEEQLQKPKTTKPSQKVTNMGKK